VEAELSNSCRKASFSKQSTIWISKEPWQKPLDFFWQKLLKSTIKINGPQTIKTKLKVCLMLINIHVAHVHIVKSTRSNFLQHIGAKAPANEKQLSSKKYAQFCLQTWTL